MTLHTRDSITFQRYQDRAARTASLFEGMPVGIELLAKWFVKDFQFTEAGDIPGGAGGPGAGWTVTTTGTGVLALSDDLFPPHLLVPNSAADNDSIEAQYTAAVQAGEFFKLRAGKRAYFRCAFTLEDANNDIDAVTECDLFLGFAITDTDVIDGATDFIGFHKADGSATINFVAGKNAGAAGALVDQIVQSTGVTLTAADAGAIGTGTIHTFEFVADGTGKVHIYADGAYKVTVASSTQLPDDEQLAPTIAFQNGEGLIKIMNLTQFLVALER